MIDIKIRKELTYIPSPIPGKSREIEVAHGRSIHLKDKKLFAPLLIAIRDVLNNVATRGDTRKVPGLCLFCFTRTR